MWFWFCELLYCVCASECNAYVHVFEEVGYLSYSWTAVGENCPFLFLFVFVSLSHVLCVFCCVCDFSCVMTLSRKLLIFAMVFISSILLFAFLLLAVGIAFL